MLVAKLDRLSRDVAFISGLMAQRVPFIVAKSDILQAIRRKCLGCCCFQPGEVRECPVSTCGLWPYRLGRDPKPSRTRGFGKPPVYTGSAKADVGQVA